MRQLQPGERKAFTERLLARQQEIVDILCSGSPENMEESRDLTGYLRCIKDVFIILEEVRKDLRKNEEGNIINANSSDEDT